MTNRTQLRNLFLADTGWGAATCRLLAGDASNRRYDRLQMGSKTAVFMDAPTEKGEAVEPFIRIARHLAEQGLSAPRVLAEDIDYGFLLLEDLGDDLFARLTAQDAKLEMPLYEAAVDVLIHLHTAKPPKNIAAYTPPLMAELAVLAVDWYAKEGPPQPSCMIRRRLKSNIEALLHLHASDHSVLIQRDYHSENLLWLPERAGTARVGLLDFQDAMSGHRAYDLVSLLTDARRDVSPAVQKSALRHYIEKSGVEKEPFLAAYAVLSLQRNLRILGVFARLSLLYGKPSYIDMIPRVWDHMLAALDQPELNSIRSMILGALPEPSPSKLSGLRDKCRTDPMR